MKFDHSKLLGRIREFGLTQADVAKEIGLTLGTVSGKLKNKSRFTTEEIDGICRLLDISPEEIGVYFFAK